MLRWGLRQRPRATGQRSFLRAPLRISLRSLACCESPKDPSLA